MTLIFRRWKRPQVIAGRVYRTAAGRLDVTNVAIVAKDEITPDDAKAAGYSSVEALVSEFRNDPRDPIYRIEFRHLDEPDPRTELANDADLDAESVAEIDRRLARFDSASSYGPCSTFPIPSPVASRIFATVPPVVRRKTYPLAKPVTYTLSKGSTATPRGP